MAKGKSAHPHRSKPYELKVAERAAAKRAMRSGGGQKSVDNSVRPDTPEGTPNPQEESRLIGGPDAERARQ